MANNEQQIDSSEINRTKTPSGNIIVNKASDIRTFFSPKRSKSPLKQRNLQTPKITQPLLRKAKKLRAKQHGHHASVSKRVNKENQNKKKRKKCESSLQVDCQSSISSSSASNWETQDSELSNCDSENLEDETAFLYQLATLIKPATEEQLFVTPIMSIEDKNVQHRDDMELSESDTEEGIMHPEKRMKAASSPKDNISLRDVISKIDQLSLEVSNLKKSDGILDLAEVKKSCVEATVESISDAFKLERQTNVEHSQMIKHGVLKAEIIAQVLDRIQHQLVDVTQRVENLELNNAKKAVVLTGLYLMNKNKEDNIVQLQTFFDNMCGIQIVVDDYFTMGLIEPKPIVIYLQTMEDRRLLMKYKNLLKGIKNEDNKPYFVNEYLPAANQEKKRRERDIIQTNKEKENNDPDKVEIVYGKGGIIIQGEVYKKRVTVPLPSDLIDLQPDEIANLMRMPITKGQQVVKDKSLFTAYTTSVNDVKKVREYYKMLKLIQPTARHIVCVYNITREPVYYNSDYVDDEEHGAGRLVLEMMKRQEIDNQVVFIARKYGGLTE